MPSSDYQAKSAYQGDVAVRYDRDRKTEPLWEIEQAFAAALIAQLPPGAVVMDIPAGTGRFVGMLLARGIEVQALDISADMLAELRRQYPTESRLHVAVGDAERLEAADSSIDCIISWRFFHLLPLATIDRVLGEFRRVCRGRMIIQVLPARTGGLATRLPSVVKAVLRPVRRLLRPAPKTPWSHIPSFIHAERDLLRLFARNRLKVVEAATLASYQNLPVRVYTLERDGA